MCVETLRTVLVFLSDHFEGSHAYVYTTNECFPIYLLRNPINVCWNPQNRACFSRTINLRGHMLRFSWHMNVFPPLSLETWYMCVKTLRTGLVFPRQSIWGVTCLGLVDTWMFSHLCPWKHDTCVWKPSEQGFFFWDDRFEGSHA